MEPVEYDLKIYQGQTFSLSFIWKDELGTPIDLTGYTARMHIRAAVKAATTLIELTSENGHISIGPAPGQVKLEIPAAVSTPIVVPSGVYDLELESPSGFVRRLLMGKVTFVPEVTR